MIKLAATSPIMKNLTTVDMSRLFSINHLLILFALTIISTPAHSQSCKKKYQPYLEPGARITECGGNYSLEKTTTGEFILKRYYPKTGLMTHRITYKTARMKEMHGSYEWRWDDGSIVSRGIYIDGSKEGEWIENEVERGEYVSNQRNGTWEYLRPDSSLKETRTYDYGLLHGEYKRYDSLGNLAETLYYKQGDLIAESLDSTSLRVESVPRFQGCENLGLEPKELQVCATTELLKYVYSHIKYPSSARANDIEGTAMAKFVIDTEGLITDIEIKNGVSTDIEAEVMRMLESMPAWIPGMQEGKKVRVQFTLPIKFKLQ